MIRSLLIYIIMLASLQVLAQETEADYLQLVKAESELKGLFEQLYVDSITYPGNVLKRIQFIMPEVLAFPGGMDFPWSKLDRIGVRTSQDSMIRIFTWHVMEDPETYRYFGYIQVAQKRDKFEVFPLVDNCKLQQGVFNLEQSTDDWYGKLYYGIVTKKAKRKTYYTLLGMDFNNSRSNLKFVEMMVIQRGRPQFKGKSFSNGKEAVDRVVLEYTDQVAITVRYDDMLEMIAYDHLVPLHPVYENNFEFYGPDGSFEGLQFEDGIWILKNDIDVRMQY